MVGIYSLRTLQHDIVTEAQILPLCYGVIFTGDPILQTLPNMVAKECVKSYAKEYSEEYTCGEKV